MNKEFKVVIWMGILFFIAFLYSFSRWPQEDANALVNILLYGYIGFALLFFAEGVYKWIKRLRQHDTSKQ